MQHVQADLRPVIVALCDELVRNVERQDAAALTRGFYSDDAVLLPAGAPLVQGRADIEAFWEHMFASGLAAVRLDTVRVTGDGDHAWELGRFQMTIRKDDGATQQPEGKYLVVFRRQSDGTWRAVADMFNADA